MTSLDLESLRHSFAIQAESPPGKDIHIAHCYIATLKLLEDPTHPISTLLSDTLRVRPDDTADHLVNLFLRSVNFLQIWIKEDQSYPHRLETVESWQRELDDIATNHRHHLEKLLKEKRTSTTIYQRYIGAKSLITLLTQTGRTHLSLLDLGCGGMYGTIGLCNDLPFAPLRKDHSQNSFFSQLAFSPLTASLDGVGIDQENPFTDDSRRWRLACRYPKEFSTLWTDWERESGMYNLNHTRFQEGSMFDLRSANIEAGSQDLVIANTSLYQWPNRQDELYQEAWKVLKPDGILVITDFAKLDPKSNFYLDYNSSFLGETWGYRMFVAKRQTGFLEMWQFDNGRCNEVRPGANLEEVLQLLSKPKIKKGVKSPYAVSITS